MKKVAATSGQSVSFAVFFLVEEIAPVGNWAGRERVLNFLSRPPSAILALSGQVLSLERVRKEKNTANPPRCKKNMHASEYFFSRSFRPSRREKLKNSRPRKVFATCRRATASLVSENKNAG
jgi:hypothetical protein